MINLCVLGCPPASVYKGYKGGVRPALWRRTGGVLLLPGVGLPPPILFQLGFPRGKEGEGWPATSPSPNRTRGGGRRAATLGCSFLLSTKAH